MLGELLRKSRVAAGLTQEELAFKAKISRNYVSLLEQGVKSPTVSTLLKVCRALNVSAGKLIEKVERQKK